MNKLIDELERAYRIAETIDEETSDAVQRFAFVRMILREWPTILARLKAADELAESILPGEMSHPNILLKWADDNDKRLGYKGSQQSVLWRKQYAALASYTAIMED